MLMELRGTVVMCGDEDREEKLSKVGNEDEEQFERRERKQRCTIIASRV